MCSWRVLQLRTSAVFALKDTAEAPRRVRVEGDVVEDHLDHVARLGALHLDAEADGVSDGPPKRSGRCVSRARQLMHARQVDVAQVVCVVVVLDLASAVRCEPRSLPCLRARHAPRPLEAVDLEDAARLDRGHEGDAAEATLSLSTHAARPELTRCASGS
jgi:hypothetical protein